MKKEDALVPVEKSEASSEGAPLTQTEEEYRRAQQYFRQSFVQAVKTNAALLTVLGLFVMRGLRYAWEAVSRHFPWRK
jgi:predicted Zn-dependent peptidase